MTKDIDLAKFLTQERHDIHLIGVAGSGMSGIAGLLLQLGHQVSGSDKVDSLETDRLQRLGLKFYQQHRAADAREAELVIYSSAIKKDNPILKSAQERELFAARKPSPQSWRLSAGFSSLECTAKPRRPR
jgi:UDP-N-acetylmuramate-alanine ligase